MTSFPRAGLSGWLVLAAALLPPIALAQAEGAERPRVGLVLGGGGAKGAAHIGILRVLDELRVPIDCVAGTSMGALVGGTFATGMPPAEIEREVLALDWTETVGGQGLRGRTPINVKLQQLAYSNPMERPVAGEIIQ